MNKGFYIASLVLSVIFLCVCGYYMEEVSDARYNVFFDSLNTTYSSNYNSYSSYDNSDALTEEGGLLVMLFLLFFLTTDLLGLIKIKRPTTKVLSILSISMGGVLLVWDLLMISSPNSMSFDEVGPVFILFSFVVLAFSIVGIVQSTRFSRSKNVSNKFENSDLLDS